MTRKAIFAVAILIGTLFPVSGGLLAQSPQEGSGNGGVSPTPTLDLRFHVPPAPTAVTAFYDAEQRQRGGDRYEFSCSTCHGDRGQGLTEEWRATWAPGKQNCWQAKCHNPSGLPEGFLFPKFVPALIGPHTLTRFATAQDLFDYLKGTMPFQLPGFFPDEDYWALTAFLLDAQSIPAGGQRLDATNAAKIRLRPVEVASEPIATAASTPPDWRGVAGIGALFLVILGGIGVTWRVRRRP